MKVLSELTMNQKIIIKERLPIFDFRAREIGHLDVKIWPASSKDKIIGSDLTVHVEIKAAKGLPASVDSTFVKYSLLGNSILKNKRKYFVGQNELRSKTKSGLNPSFQRYFNTVFICRS